MSIKILRAGILDTIQDGGRYGYQHLGVNPGGAMDKFSASVVNFLTNNSMNEAVIELHFPASVYLFQQPALIAIGGAGFSPAINGELIAINQPIFINKGSILQFKKNISGARAYLAIQGGFQLTPWLGSNSTHLKATAGGFNGRLLKNDDEISFGNNAIAPRSEEYFIFPWRANADWEDNQDSKILVLPGNEWNRLTGSAKENFQQGPFKISGVSDRMGYRLNSQPLTSLSNEEIVSSGVNFGTVQLLPDGQLIILMADHQTTGGYPRIAHVISAHHSKLAQMRPGETVCFKVTDQRTAENLLVKQQQHLQQLQNACTLRFKEYLHVS